MTQRDGESHGLILSGGGAFAAYEIGVLKALFTGSSPATGYRPSDFHVVTGTSSGAFNGAMLVSRWEADPRDAIAAMERVWLHEVASNMGGCNANGVFRWRGNPLNFFDVQCLFSHPLEFFRDRLLDTAFFTQQFVDRALLFARSRASFDHRLFELFDFSALISNTPFPNLLRRTVQLENIRRSPKVLQIAATNWETGEVKLFGNQDMTEEEGDLIIMGSSAIPGFFSPVLIPPEPYVDGGLLMNTPLSPAIHSGATVLHTIYMDPDVSNIPLSALQTTLGTLQRTFSIAMAAAFNRDIEMAKRINQGLGLLQRGDRSHLAIDQARALVEFATEIVQRHHDMEPYRQLTIHRYHPSDLLGSTLGILAFERPTVEKLIDRGYRDAVLHDCGASGCVLPEESKNEEFA